MREKLAAEAVRAAEKRCDDLCRNAHEFHAVCAQGTYVQYNTIQQCSIMKYKELVKKLQLGRLYC